MINIRLIDSLIIEKIHNDRKLEQVVHQMYNEVK